jgi:hypothetical protein
MTYGDFHGHMVGLDRGKLFSCFDVIIFDEAFMAVADVYVAKRCFAVYASANVSLLMCSATIRKDVVEQDMGASSLGVYITLEDGVSVAEAVKSGRLISTYLVDRTVVFVATDEDVTAAYDHYGENGVDVRRLDSAASVRDELAVNEWLKGDSTTPRVLVAHVDYGIGHNFFVAYAVVWPQRAFYRFGDDRAVLEREPLSAEMLEQAKSRTGRGLVEGSGGIVLSGSVAPTVELHASERMRAFVMMNAAAVRPLRAAWPDCYGVFPDGLSTAAACSLMKIALPVEVTARYLADDGQVASKYSVALTMFSQPDHYLVPSDYVEPSSLACWSTELMGGYDGSAACGKEVRVPFLAEGELRVILHAISAIAEGDMSLARWRPQASMRYHDGMDSGDEQNVVSRVPVRLRRITDEPVVSDSKAISTAKTAWTFQQVTAVPCATVQQKRYGSVVNRDRFRQAMLDLEALLPDYSVPTPPVSAVKNEHGEEVVEIKAPEMGQVESPGGSVVCELPVMICEKMNQGVKLSAPEFVLVVQRSRSEIVRFCTSKFFDCFAGPWDSFLDSLLVERVRNEVVRCGLYADAYAIVDGLRARFSAEVLSALANSNVFKKRYLGLFSRRPNTDKLMRSVRAGAFNGVAQTEGFLNRIRTLKTKVDQVLLEAESAGVYLPVAITAAQRGLPVRGELPVGVVGDRMVPMPRVVQRDIMVTDAGYSRSAFMQRFAQ